MRIAAGVILMLAAASVHAQPAAVVLPRGTPVRLMVLNEVTTHSAHVGDRFPLLVDGAVIVDGVTLVPVGTKAWGEVIAARENGSAGTAGRLSVRLLSITLPGGGEVPLADASIEARGAGAGAQTAAFAVATFGVLSPLALFARGNNAKLKAGEIVEGQIAEMVTIDPGGGTVTLAHPSEAAALTP